MKNTKIKKIDQQNECHVLNAVLENDFNLVAHGSFYCVCTMYVNSLLNSKD
jgi:hypothetical protein